MIDPRTAVKRPIVTLSILFCAWKLLLLLILTLASGPAYDTSSELAAGVNAPTVLTRLTKWDAIFFTSIAQRGYLYEQEWAFGYGYARLVGLVAGGASAMQD